MCICTNNGYNTCKCYCVPAGVIGLARPALPAGGVIMPASARVTCISKSFFLSIVVPARVGEESCVSARVVVPIVVPARVGEESCVPVSARVGVSK